MYLNFFKDSSFTRACSLRVGKFCGCTWWLMTVTKVLRWGFFTVTVCVIKLMLHIVLPWQSQQNIHTHDFKKIKNPHNITAKLQCTSENLTKILKWGIEFKELLQSCTVRVRGFQHFAVRVDKEFWGTIGCWAAYFLHLQAGLGQSNEKEKVG